MKANHEKNTKTQIINIAKLESTQPVSFAVHQRGFKRTGGKTPMERLRSISGQKPRQSEMETETDG
jgi:hypothetical protein